MSEETLERIYTINLGKVMLTPNNQRAKRAINMIRSFATKHMKSENIKIEEEISHLVWERGIRHPPRKIRVKISKDDDGNIIVSKYQDEKKMGEEKPKKEEKKSEDKKAEEKPKEKKEEKKVEEKPKEKKEEKKVEEKPKTEEKTVESKQKTEEKKSEDKKAEEKPKEKKEEKKSSESKPAKKPKE